MKKVMTITLAAVFALGILAGCGAKEGEATGQAESNTVQGSKAVPGAVSDSKGGAPITPQ